MCIKMRWRAECGLLNLAVCGVFVSNQHQYKSNITDSTIIIID